jgi:hypothetical protein
MSTSPGTGPVSEDPEESMADDTIPGHDEPEPETPDNYAQAGPDETSDGQPITTEADEPGSMGGDNGGA